MSLTINYLLNCEGFIFLSWISKCLIKYITCLPPTNCLNCLIHSSNYCFQKLNRRFYAKKRFDLTPSVWNVNRWPSHLCSDAVMSASTKSALLQADYQEPDCFPEQQAAINEAPRLSLRPRWYSLGTEQMCPGSCPPRGAERCRCGIIHLRPFHSGPGVEASTVGSDPGTLLGSLGSSICATAHDLNEKLHWNKPNRLQKQVSPVFERKIGVCNF